LSPPLCACRVPPAALAALPDPTAHIFIETGVSAGAELLHRLERLRPLLEGRRAGGRRVRLLVVDSIAGVFRELEGGGVDELTGRTELLFRVAALLRWAMCTTQVVQGVQPLAGGRRARERRCRPCAPLA